MTLHLPAAPPSLLLVTLHLAAAPPSLLLVTLHLPAAPPSSLLPTLHLAPAPASRYSVALRLAAADVEASLTRRSHGHALPCRLTARVRQRSIRLSPGGAAGACAGRSCATVRMSSTGTRGRPSRGHSWWS